MAIDKKNNFKRLAESRTNKILDSLVLLGNLSNTSYYDYSMDQIDEIFNVIEEEMDGEYAFAPAHMARQSAAAVAVLGYRYYQEGRV